MHPHNVNTAAQNPSERWVLTATEFADLSDYVQSHGTFTGVSGIDWQALSRLEEVDEPGDAPEGLTLYFSGGWPVALYLYDLGYVVLPGCPALLTGGQRQS